MEDLSIITDTLIGSDQMKMEVIEAISINGMADRWQDVLQGQCTVMDGISLLMQGSDED